MTTTIYRGNYPLIAYGSPQDLSTWGLPGGGTRTAGQADPFGGTSAVQLSGVGVYLDSSNFLLRTTQDPVIEVMVLQGTSPTTTVKLTDITAGFDRGLVTLTWAGLGLANSLGASVSSVLALGGGWYILRFKATAIVTANSHRLRLFSDNGTTKFYVRHVIRLTQPLDEAKNFTAPREGSDWVQWQSGVEDAWNVGYDKMLSGTIRHIPNFLVGTSQATPWAGEGEFAGVNSSVDHWLNYYARDKQTFLWVPDRTNALVNVSSYLASPMEGEPEFENDYTRKLTVALRSATGTPYNGY